MVPGEKPLLSGLSAEAVENEFKEALNGMEQTELERLMEASIQSFRSSNILKGRIVAVSGEDVVVDIGYKSEGYVPLSEFREDEAKVGGDVEVLLETIETNSGVILLSKRKADKIKNWERVIAENKVGDTVTGKAVRKIKGGLLVDIGVPAFLPASQVDIRRVPDVGEFLGRELSCKIIKVDEDRKNIVLSRRRLLEEERQAMKEQLFAELECGQIRRGVVKNITEFGAFVDLGGIDGLLHITDMSWSKVVHPSEIVRPDEVVDVMILDFDTERERISLGLKQLTPNPWTNIEERYPVGSRHRGEVVSLTHYGAFVRLEEGVEGLVHVSEMSWTKQVNHPSELVEAGDMVDVIVLEVEKDHQEISLGMKQTQADPWTLVEEKFPIGTRMKGKVKNLTGYGAFVELEEGIDGLLHVSDMSWTKKITHPSQVLKKGDEVDVVVQEVDAAKKRISLGMKQLQNDPWLTDIPVKYHRGMKVRGKVTKRTNFGAFVEIGPGLEGLVHVSEFAESEGKQPKEGDEIEVRIISIDPKDRKISLSIKGTQLPDSDFEQDIEYHKYVQKPTPTGPTLASLGEEAFKKVAEAQKEKKDKDEEEA